MSRMVGEGLSACLCGEPRCEETALHRSTTNVQHDTIIFWKISTNPTPVQSPQGLGECCVWALPGFTQSTQELQVIELHIWSTVCACLVLGCYGLVKWVSEWLMPDNWKRSQGYLTRPVATSLSWQRSSWWILEIPRSTRSAMNLAEQ